MEVLEHGNTKIKQVCNKCGCKLLYDKNDVKLSGVYVGQLPNGKANELEQWIYWYIRCPECDEKIKVNTPNI